MQLLSLARDSPRGSPCRTCGSVVVGPQGRWWDTEPSCRLRGGGCLPGRSRRALRGSRQQTGRSGQEGRSPSGQSLLAVIQSCPKLCPTSRVPVTPSPSSGCCLGTLKKAIRGDTPPPHTHTLPTKSHSDMERRSRRQGGILSLWEMPEQPVSLVPAPSCLLPKPGQGPPWGLSL